MISPPSQYPARMLGLALTVLAIALALYVSAQLILAILPVLIGAGVVCALGVGTYSAYRLRHPR